LNAYSLFETLVITINLEIEASCVFVKKSQPIAKIECPCKFLQPELYSPSMNEKLQAFKNSTCFPWELICRLSKLDFSANEIMVILLCLTELDNADCLRLR